VLKQTNKKIYA